MLWSGHPYFEFHKMIQKAIKLGLMLYMLFNILDLWKKLFLEKVKDENKRDQYQVSGLACGKLNPQLGFFSP